MIKQLCDGIYKFYNDSALIKAALTGGLYFTQAPQDVTSPYCVYYFIGSKPDEFMGGKNDKIEKAEIQFNFFNTKIDGGVELANVVHTFEQGFNQQILSISDYNCLHCGQTLSMPFEFINDTWQMVLSYEIWLQYKF